MKYRFKKSSDLIFAMDECRLPFIMAMRNHKIEFLNFLLANEFIDLGDLNMFKIKILHERWILRLNSSIPINMQM